MRTINGDSKASNNRLPDELIIDDDQITESEAVALKLNTYFTSIADILNENDIDIPNIDTETISNFVKNKVPKDEYFNILFISAEQVHLECSKATGLDGIGLRIFQTAASVVSPSIAMLINKSIATGTFPDQLKQAKVFPIFKSGRKSDPSSYRPISILPTVSKNFEKHVNKHLMGYLNKHNLLLESQSGFRHKHSCQTALTDNWSECIDKGDMIGASFKDFRKAFDLVDHSILIQKLAICKFSSLTLQWFGVYHQQPIESDKGLTDFSLICTGVPQGSILGPKLFLIFINDRHLCYEHCFSDLYAVMTMTVT